MLFHSIIRKLLIRQLCLAFSVCLVDAYVSDAGQQVWLKVKHTAQTLTLTITPSVAPAPINIPVTYYIKQCPLKTLTHVNNLIVY